MIKLKIYQNMFEQILKHVQAGKNILKQAPTCFKTFKQAKTCPAMPRHD